MARITFLQPDGKSVAATAAEGNLMEAARAHGVDGIDGNCGGVCSCSTCHVRVSPEWMGRVGQPSPTEQDLLDLEAMACPRSRLSCQIEVTPALDGLTVEVVKG